MQIQGHPARSRTGGAVQSEELSSALHFQLLPPLIQTIRREAAVEVAIHVATVDSTGFWITDFEGQRKASALQQIGLFTPLVDRQAPLISLPWVPPTTNTSQRVITTLRHQPD